MSIQIFETTFIDAVADLAEVGDWYVSKINGKVDVDLGRGKVVSAWAIKHNNGDLSVLGFLGRYIKGNKDWIASVRTTTWNGERGIRASFGRDDRCGKFNKMNCIFWNPDRFFSM